MTDINRPNTGPEYARAVDAALNEGSNYPTGSVERVEITQEGMLNAMMAQTAAIVMLTEVIATATGADHYELDSWREAVPASPLKACRGKEIRRPACEERHTDDCAYADPPPEPKHVLLDVGTRVLVSDWRMNPEGELRLTNPQAGRISGHAAGGHKYRWQYEFEPGIYSEHEQFAFADNRVEVHPDGPECPSPPQPVKREPTGLRVYVENHHGKQGHVVEVSAMNGAVMFRVQWYTPGTEPVWKAADTLTVIPADRVERCERGQTRQECTEIDPCEPCQQDIDAEGDAIEESMR